MKQWSPERKVEIEQALALIERQFPKLAPVDLCLLGEGWDNTVYQVNDAFVFRFPRRQIAVGLIETEGLLLPKLQGRLTLPIPQPVFFGKPDLDYPWPFIGYTMLSGTTACRLHLSEDERFEVAKPLADFLRSLHAISGKEAAQMGAGGDTIGRLDVADRIPKLLENLEKIRSWSLAPNVDDLFQLARNLHDVRDTDGKRSLVHGDLYFRHLLIDDDKRLCGVIDWGDMHVGNPAIDLKVAYAFLNAKGRKEFFRSYGSVDENTHRLAHFRALYHSSLFLVFAHDIADDNLMHEARIGLANCLSS